MADIPQPDLNDPKLIDSVVSALPQVSLLCAADLVPESIKWIWDGWLARRKLQILAGQPGDGKTTLGMSLAATISCGGRFPDGNSAPVGDVLIWTGEDGVADTLVPRLMAAGADLQRVHFVDGTIVGRDARPFDPSIDIPKLQDVVSQSELKPALLIVDPIVMAISGDGNKNSEVRRGLTPIVEFAEQANCAALGITHFSKGTSGRNVVERVTGSLAFGAAARLVMATAKLPDNGGRVLVRAKSNIGVDGSGYEYDIEPCSIGTGIGTTRVRWGDQVEGEARDLLPNENAPSAPKQDRAADFLMDILSHGPVPVAEVTAAAKAQGISGVTLQRAKKSLGVESQKQRGSMGGNWAWILPKGTFEN